MCKHNSNVSTCTGIISLLKFLYVNEKIMFAFRTCVTYRHFLIADFPFKPILIVMQRCIKVLSIKALRHHNSESNKRLLNGALSTPSAQEPTLPLVTSC